MEPKPYGKVILCLDPARLNQAIIRPVNRGPTISDIFPKLTCVFYHTLIDPSSIDHNQKQQKKSSHLTTFTSEFSTCRYSGLPFGGVLTGDRCQRKIDEIFKELCNGFGIADNMLIVRYIKYSIDHNGMLGKLWKYAGKKTVAHSTKHLLDAQ